MAHKGHRSSFGGWEGGGGRSGQRKCHQYLKDPLENSHLAHEIPEASRAQDASAIHVLPEKPFRPDLKERKPFSESYFHFGIPGRRLPPPLPLAIPTNQPTALLQPPSPTTPAPPYVSSPAQEYAARALPMPPPLRLDGNWM
ncbi:hypothetical protein GWI33_012009 [Rhynchophorus ferrugineus]|uniref:Uncharacterized protein n=1 Tax=Rhynchophorus ferrugineus TaxID=354439 RepID=A0A834IWF5_RHYFE|nr:hypothetical protein GWI33_012009 [Rhynchophorus ferrugineus]